MGPESVQIPADLSGEDVFFGIGPLKMSMRQTVTVLGSFFVWFGASHFMIQPILGLQQIWALMFLGWMPLLGCILAFVKIRGRPIDVWAGDWMSFHFNARTYVLRDEHLSGTAEALLDYDPDLDVMRQQWRRHGVEG